MPCSEKNLENIVEIKNVSTHNNLTLRLFYDCQICGLVAFRSVRLLLLHLRHHPLDAYIDYKYENDPPLKIKKSNSVQGVTNCNKESHANQFDTLENFINEKESSTFCNGIVESINHEDEYNLCSNSSSHTSKSGEDKKSLNDEILNLLNENSRIDLLCKYCGSSFACLEKLTEHERCHESKNLDIAISKNSESQNHIPHDDNVITTKCENDYGNLKEKSFKIINYCNKEKGSNNSLLTRPENKSVKSKSTCSECNKVYSSQYSLKRHFSLYHKDSQLKCSYCPSSFISHASLASHERKHTNCIIDKQFQCAFCDKKFITSNKLETHIRSHTGERPFWCNFCNKKFTTFSSRKIHEKIHTGDRPYNCELCARKFATSSSLKVHERVHSGEKPFVCDECPKSFAQLGGLKVHLKTHSKEKPFKCSQCPKSFSLLEYLRSHERVHSGEKPFKCKHCGRAFADMSARRRHERIHTGEKPYICRFCDRRFTTFGVKAIHERIHTGEKPYKCTFCGRTFADLSYCVNHERTHTGEKPFKCSYCDKHFAQTSSVRSHERIHTGEKPFACRLCGRRFTQQHHCKSHEKTHSKKSPQDEEIKKNGGRKLPDKIKERSQGKIAKTTKIPSSISSKSVQQNSGIASSAISNNEISPVTMRDKQKKFQQTEFNSNLQVLSSSPKITINSKRNSSTATIHAENSHVEKRRKQRKCNIKVSPNDPPSNKSSTVKSPHISKTFSPNNYSGKHDVIPLNHSTTSKIYPIYNTQSETLSTERRNHDHEVTPHHQVKQSVIAENSESHSLVNDRNIGECRTFADSPVIRSMYDNQTLYDQQPLNQRHLYSPIVVTSFQNEISIAPPSVISSVTTMSEEMPPRKTMMTTTNAINDVANAGMFFLNSEGNLVFCEDSHNITLIGSNPSFPYYLPSSSLNSTSQDVYQKLQHHMSSDLTSLQMLQDCTH